MAIGFFKKLLNIAKLFVQKTLPAGVNKGFEAAGKVINTVAPVVNKVAGVLQATPFGGITNQIAGGINTPNSVIQKGRGFMSNLQ
jgi:hypothetical protein